MTELQTSKQTQHALIPYGDRAEVQSLAKRIMAMHPAAKQIGDRGALLLAQLGVSLGLNPLPGTGHIHAWIDKGNLCVHIGLEGRMALARKDSPFSHNERPMNPDEAELNNLRPGDKGAICELFRHDHTQLFAKLGLPVKPVIGIGVATANEYPPRGRTLYWRASQRAIKDAIRLAYSFVLPGEMLNDISLFENAPEEIIEGDFSISDETVAPTTQVRTAEEQARHERDKAAMYGEDETDSKQSEALADALETLDIAEREVLAKADQPAPNPSADLREEFSNLWRVARDLKLNPMPKPITPSMSPVQLKGRVDQLKADIAKAQASLVAQ